MNVVGDRMYNRILVKSKITVYYNILSIFIKMEPFKLVKEIFVQFGLNPTEFIFRQPLNKRAILLLILQIISITSYSLFLILDAKTFTQYSNGAFMTIAVILVFYSYVICIWYRKRLLTLMSCLEIVINQREQIDALKALNIII